MIIEAIGVVRDVVFIVSVIIITTMVVMMGRVFLNLARKTEDLRSFAVDLVDGVLDPLRNLLFIVGHRRKR